jgi:single-stranded-DNA-specific exonuclease
MDVACDVIELLSTKDQARAVELAAKLDRLNSERQQEEVRILKEICERLDQNPAQLEPLCLVLDGEGWHRGVIGIVATRVVERYSRPTLVISREPAAGEAHGSGRSIPPFHLLQALEDASCRDLFTRFGGHAHAVGFSLPAQNIAALREAMSSYAALRLTPQDLEPLLKIDAEIGVEEINHALIEQLAQLEPCGLDNREPVLALRGATLRQPAKLLKDQHLKLRVGASGNGRAYDALGWRMAARMNDSALANGLLDLAFTLEESANPEFPGIQLMLLDFRAAEAVAPEAVQTQTSSA